VNVESFDFVRVKNFYRDRLHNPHWGEQITLRPNNTLAIAMLFQGLEQQEAEALWQPFFGELAAAPDDYNIAEAPQVMALPASVFGTQNFSRHCRASHSLMMVLAHRHPTYSGQATQFLHGYDPRGFRPRFWPAKRQSNWLAPCLPHPDTGACRCISTKGLQAEAALRSLPLGTPP